jgi:DNA-3-methyladenine glycosylase I
VTYAERSLATGPDGHRRCWWSLGSSGYVRYHDEEWGRPVVDDDRMFERLCLEAFQAGLSWLTILRKREGFRDAFAGFRIGRVAAFGDDDVERLLGDERIVRNRRKIEAVIENARRAAESFARFVWSFAPLRPGVPRRRSELPSATAESLALARELKRLGFRFVGPTTAYALMQACGLVNDHMAGCWVRRAVDEQRAAAARELAGRQTSAYRHEWSG